MNKKALWDKFIRTGKVSDYLHYRRAEQLLKEDADEEDFANEIYPEWINGKGYSYDDEDERYSDS